MKRIDEIFTIFKRETPIPSMPEPIFEDNWRQESFERNVHAGINAMACGKDVVIHDDGRGYETAINIKNGFLLEYQKRLAEKIEITQHGGIINITIKR